jgi:hypothetical protein
MKEKSKEYNLSVLSNAEKELTLKDSNDTNVFELPNSDFNLPLRIKTFSDTKAFEVFVKSSERLVRGSIEYRLWVQYITEHMGHTHCALSKESMNECPIEVHHHPITLYTIVKGVINKLLSTEQEFSTFDVATKVIELHFQNKVGYVTLISSLHSKYHSGFLNIPIEIVNGNYKHIIQNYVIEEEECDRIAKLCNVHIEDSKQEWSRGNYPGIADYSDHQISAASDNKQISM